jgi:LacI family transcriptional regulator
VVHRSDTLIEKAAHHLLTTGRRRLAIILPDVAIHDLKIDAARRALAKLGRDPDELIEIRFHIDYPEIQPTLGQVRLVEALNTHIPDEVPFDALMCVSDEDAACCVEWLRGKKLVVPGDVAVTGANDTLLGRMLDPPLATGLRHNKEVAEAVERLLFHRLEDSSIAPQRAFVDMEFVYRESAGPPMLP